MSARVRPQRTCVGCGQTGSIDHLVRLRCCEDTHLVLARNLGHGRGCWIHPWCNCAKRAVRQRAFRRAFRREVNVTLGELSRLLGIDREDSESGLEADGHPMSTQR